MKLEIYQVGKLPPLTVVECDRWCLAGMNCDRLECSKDGVLVAMFFKDKIAGFKKVGETNGKSI